SNIAVTENIPYKSGQPDEYERQRCVLDVYAPPSPRGVLVWFHGGGLTGGDKREAADFARSCAAAEFVVIAPNYRLSPAATYPAYVQDAAAAVAWAVEHATEY